MPTVPFQSRRLSHFGVEPRKSSPKRPFESLSHCSCVWSIALVPRAHWNGFLKLSLVSCPIALYPAVAKTERISFRQVNRQTGHRLRQQLVDAVTGEAVVSGQKARGYEVG